MPTLANARHAIIDERRLARKFELYGEAYNVPPLPERSHYTLEQVLGDWWPGRRADPLQVAVPALLRRLADRSGRSRCL
jgi:hypothetical protein